MMVTGDDLLEVVNGVIDEFIDDNEGRQMLKSAYDTATVYPLFLAQSFYIAWTGEEMTDDKSQEYQWLEGEEARGFIEDAIESAKCGMTESFKEKEVSEELTQEVIDVAQEVVTIFRRHMYQFIDSSMNKYQSMLH